MVNGGLEQTGLYGNDNLPLEEDGKRKLVCGGREGVVQRM